MDDLIERLRARLTAERAAPETGHNAADRERSELIRLLREAAAALEAAREDAERYRFIAADKSPAWEEELNAAIDASREAHND